MTRIVKPGSIPVGDRVSIFLRGKTWYCNFQQNGHQVRRSLGTTSKKQAILRAQALETDLARGDAPNHFRVATLSEVTDAFLAHAAAEDRSPKTLTKYKQVTREVAQLATERSITLVDGLGAQFADTYRQRLKQRGNKPNTIYTKLVILASVTLFALRRQMCAMNPLSGYRMKKPKSAPQPCWTPEQADQIVQASPATYQPYLQFLRETGCRAGEAKHLTWDDIQADCRVILIRPKEGAWGQWRPKSGDQRSVPITDKLAELLRTIPRKGQWVFCAPPSPGFPSLNRQISERRALVALKRVLKTLALPGKLHTFRHTYISQALTRGVPEAVVRQWVGHVDPEILRLYTHVADEVSQAYVSRFSGKSQARDS